MLYNIVFNEGEPNSITAFLDNGPVVATTDHPRFAEILSTLQGGPTTQEEVRRLFDLSHDLTVRFAGVTERVAIRNGTVYFDQVPVNGALADLIVEFESQGIEDFKALVNFMEKIETNPNPHSREHLFRWLGANHFAIAADGDIVAYKGITGAGYSTTAGHAFVNNREINGAVPNAVGTVIEMPRDEVQFDPGNGCSTGLHVSNWQFARGFGTVVVSVKVNPRDVVSVPVDSGDQKMRVCRYRVVAEVTEQDPGLLYVEVEPQHTVVTVTDPVPEPVKKPKKATKKAEGTLLPEIYEDFKVEHYNALSRDDLRWLAKEWGVKIPDTKAALIERLAKEAKARKRSWKK